MGLPVLDKKSFFGPRRGRVAVLRIPKHTEMTRHRHEFCEIAVVLSGTAVHVTGEFRREIGPGDVLVINSRRSHGYERTRGLNLVNILIHDEVFTRIDRQLRGMAGYHELFTTQAVRWKRPDTRDRILLNAAERVQAEEWIAKLEHEARDDSPESALIAEAYLTLIIGLVARRYRGGSAGKAPTTSRTRDGGIGNVLSWIEQNLEQPMRVSELARRAGLSERSFYRVFRETMGYTPVAYVLRARLQRAAELLGDRSERRRVAEIASACGFADSNYFSACFRRFKGCSPRAFGALAGK